MFSEALRKRILLQLRPNPRQIFFQYFFGRAISEHIVLNGFLCEERLIKALCVFLGRKDCAVIFSLNRIVGDMFYNHCSFLLVDKSDHLGDKFFWVILEHIELIYSDTL